MTKLSIFGPALLLLLAPALTKAQDSLSLQQAVQIALEQNFAVKIAQSDVEIAHLNNTRANAGLVPLVALNAGNNTNAVNFQQKLANGNEIKRPLALTNTFNTNISASWTLYDGRRMYMEKNRLQLLDDMGQLQLRATMQDIASQTALAWLEVSRQKSILSNTDEIIKVFRERLQLSTNRLNVGVGNKVDLLQAQSDVNRREKERITAQNNLRDAQRNLNTLMVRTPETPVNATSLPSTLPELPDSTAFLQKIWSSNTDLAMLQYRLLVAQNSVAQAKALTKPRVGLNGGYAFQRSDNTAGFFLFSMQHGPTLGVNFTMPLYTGGNLERQRAVAQVESEKIDLQIKQLRTQLQQQFSSLAGRSATLRQSLVLDNQNLALAREQQNIALERFRAGQSTILELREAQLALEAALFSVQQTQYDIFVTDALLQAIVGE